MLFIVVVAVAAGVGTDLVRPATSSGRLSDLRSYYATAQTDVSSCSGGLRDSLTALVAILSGTSTDRGTAEGVAVAGAQACTPVSNGNLFELATQAAPTTLNHYGVGKAGRDLYTWAYPGASLAQAQIYRLLHGHAAPGSPAARALYQELVKLRDAGARVQREFSAAARSLGGTLSPLSPPVTLPPPAVLLGR